MNPAPMTEESNDTPIRPRRSVARRVFAFFSGYQLATVLLVLVGVLTWLATLEQVDSGLYATLNKYFDWRSWYIFPELKMGDVKILGVHGYGNGMEWLLSLQWMLGFERIVFQVFKWLLPLPVPLPGGYWVCVLLFINLLLGGILRARKGWKHAGILIAHSGILFLLAGGGVAHLFSQRGNLAVMEGKTSNVAEDYYDSVVEVAEVKGGKIESVRVIDGKSLGDGM